MTTDLLIFPFGGNAKEALIAILAQNSMKPTWNVLGFIDDDAHLWGQEFCGIKVLGGSKIASDLPSTQVLAVPGKPENYNQRDKIIQRIEIDHERFATVLDPTVRVAPDALIGKNTLLMANVVISCSVKVGNHCVVLPNTVISHDSYVGDYSVIGSNVSISGSCNISQNCYIGSGTRIKDHITVGSQSMIGIGSCVINDVEENEIVAGNPARLVKNI